MLRPNPEGHCHQIDEPTAVMNKTTDAVFHETVVRRMFNALAHFRKFESSHKNKNGSALDRENTDVIF